MLKQLLSVFCLAFLSGHLLAMTPLNDEELGDVDGAGLGLVLEDFAFESGSAVGDGSGVFEIGSIRSGNAGEAVLRVSRYYIAGAGSNRGTNVMGNGVSIGQLSAPYTISVMDGDDFGITNKAMLRIAAPERQGGNILSFNTETRNERRFPNQPQSSGPRVDSVSGINLSTLNGARADWIDLGLTFDLAINNIPGQSFDVPQSLQGHVEGLNIDGTQWRLWGDNNQVLANLDLNIYADSIVFQACTGGQVSGSSCGQTVRYSDYILEGQLGYGDDQPVKVTVLNNGQLQMEVGSIAGKSRAFYDEYYSSGPRVDIHIGDISVGNQSFGSSTIANLQIQYLNVRTRDL